MRRADRLIGKVFAVTFSLLWADLRPSFKLQ
jgi:hypothetical protein